MRYSLCSRACYKFWRRAWFSFWTSWT